MADRQSNERKRRALRRAIFAPAPVALAAFVLAGCSGTHVGDSWQCPVAQGAVCTSVADADPAVGRSEPAGRLAIERPLHEPLAATAMPETRPAAVGKARPCDAECGPFAWLARLFAAHDGKPDRGAAGGTAPPLPAGDLRDSDRPTGDGPAAVESAVVEAAAGDPAAADSPPGGPQAVRAADDPRVPETLGRIWIGPFVDGAGVYREGAYVRLVIEPAHWRRP